MLHVLYRKLSVTKCHWPIGFWHRNAYFANLMALLSLAKVKRKASFESEDKIKPIKDFCGLEFSLQLSPLTEKPPKKE